MKIIRVFPRCRVANSGNSMNRANPIWFSHCVSFIRSILLLSLKRAESIGTCGERVNEENACVCPEKVHFILKTMTSRVANSHSVTHQKISQCEFSRIFTGQVNFLLLLTPTMESLQTRNRISWHIKFHYRLFLRVPRQNGN